MNYTSAVRSIKCTEADILQLVKVHSIQFPFLDLQPYSFYLLASGFKMTRISFFSHLLKKHFFDPISFNTWHQIPWPFISCWVCLVCGNVERLVSGQSWETLFLKGGYQLHDPGTNFTAMLITSTDLWLQPRARSLAGDITHTHRQTHAHLSLSGCEKITFTNGLILSQPLLDVCGAPLSIWPFHRELPSSTSYAKLMKPV